MSWLTTPLTLCTRFNVRFSVQAWAKDDSYNARAFTTVKPSTVSKYAETLARLLSFATKALQPQVAACLDNYVCVSEDQRKALDKFVARSSPSLEDVANLVASLFQPHHKAGLPSLVMWFVRLDALSSGRLDFDRLTHCIAHLQYAIRYVSGEGGRGMALGYRSFIYIYSYLFLFMIEFLPNFLFSSLFIVYDGIL